MISNADVLVACCKRLLPEGIITRFKLPGHGFYIYTTAAETRRLRRVNIPSRKVKRDNDLHVQYRRQEAEREPAAVNSRSTPESLTKIGSIGTKGQKTDCA